MPRDLKNIADNVIGQIRQGKLKMRPRIYFMVGSILTFLGVVASVATSAFAVGLINFFLRSNGRMFGRNRMEYLFSIFPWWLPVVAITGLTVGIILIRKYDFSYKVGFKKAAVLIILAIIASGWLVDVAGFNDFISRRGPMRGVMRKYLQEQNTQFDNYRQNN